MSEINLYYIYIDTKIHGTIEQLKEYFRTRVFEKQGCICVLVKYYKEIEGVIRETLTKADITYKFIKKQSDLKLLKGKAVFYLFNAQSNCRVVANRDLSHIFVTHGESHKLASIKPILKIYDHVICSGQVSVDRFLKSSIFNEHDVTNGKVITLGDTFIGRNKFIYNANSSNLVYAPTWEGGIPEEDFCSLSIENTWKIIKFCKENNLTTVLIKPHPNLGHRIKDKHDIISKITSLIKANGLEVWVLSDKHKSRKNLRWAFFKKKEKIQDHIPSNIYNVKHAITDISAMEAQFISQKIPCSVLTDKNILEVLPIPKALKEKDKNNFILPDEEISFSSSKKLEFLYQYYFSYPEGLSEKTPLSIRIQWLCKHTESQRVSRVSNCWLKY